MLFSIEGLYYRQGLRGRLLKTKERKSTPMNNGSQVFSITDHYCRQGLEAWIKTRESLPKIMRIIKHTEVTDIAGKRICRPYRLGFENLICERIFHGFYINTLCMWLEGLLKEKAVVPNMIISLGEARHLGEPLCHRLLTRNDHLPRLLHVVMNREVDPDTKVLCDFEFDQKHHIPGFDPKKMKVLIVEDFVFTGRSVALAKEKLERDGASVVGVVSFTNALSDIWPFDVPINLTFLNVGFEKYLAGTCPTCMK